MMKIHWQCAAALVVLTGGCGMMAAQEPNPTAQTQQQGQPQQPQAEMSDGVPLFKIQVVGRDIPAINYFHRKSATKIGFQGTSLLPQAKGSAKVEGLGGRTVINAEFQVCHRQMDSVTST